MCNMNTSSTCFVQYFSFGTKTVWIASVGMTGTVRIGIPTRRRTHGTAYVVRFGGWAHGGQDFALVRIGRKKGLMKTKKFPIVKAGPESSAVKSNVISRAKVISSLYLMITSTVMALTFVCSPALGSGKNGQDVSKQTLNYPN